MGLGFLAATLLTFGLTGASAVDVQHGIGFTKGCASPTAIGQPYSCTFSVRNNLDEAEDTLTINGLVDVVHAASGDVNSGNIFTSLKLDNCSLTIGVCTQTTATCSGGGTFSGTGTRADPWMNATLCTLPFGSRINVQSVSHYTVQAGDFALPLHVLRDDANLTWHDLCNDPAGTGNSNCNPNPPDVGAGSQSLITQLSSTTATAIHNAAHAVVTTVGVGTTVHDLVTVTGQGGQPAPSGNVTVDWFLNGDCSGSPAANSGPVGPLVPGAPPTSSFDATGFSFTVNTPGQRAFRAHYLGDATFTASDGPCEPLQVVDANISITPNGVNRVGDTHTFTAHVNVNDGLGGGFVNAPDGTQISFTIDSGPGTLGAPNPCTTGGGTGSCQITLNSAVTGVTTVSAHSTLSVGGVSLTRNTDGVGANSGPATKRWVNARIHITPNATNEVGQPHTFTVLLEKDLGDGAGFVAAAGEHVDFTLTPAGGATPALNAAASTCDDAGPNTNAAGQCTIVFTSPTTGTVTGHATSTLSVAGSAPFTVATDGVAPNGPDAVKTFVNANIQITPANATNPIGTNHVLTITVNALNGTIDAGPHTATASIVSGPGSFVGSPTCTYTGGGATASCTVTITSAVAGTTVVSATSNIPVNGVTITRTTNTAVNTAAGGSDNANKLWIAPDANIQITPATATNAVNTNHTLTGHVNVAADGTTFANAPAGTLITFSIVSGPGSFVGGNTCLTIAATGSCTVQITSSATGTTVIRAATDVVVLGITLHRETNDGHAGDSADAQKVWVNANIQITPATATNPVNTNHVLTITINAINGTIDAGPHTATASIVSGPGSFVGPNTCTYTGGGATATCTVTITSAATGTTVVSATSDIPVNGQTITRTTNTAVNTAAGGSGNASKVWVDANIAITPATANNPVGSNHVLTITVNAINGTIDAGPHTATASIVSGPGTFVGSPTCTYTGGAATASCTVTITSAATGTTVVSATSNIPVSGTTITRTTGTAVNTASGGSGNASKNWADSTVRTDVHDAAHNVITSVNAGAIVHDKVFVAKAAGTSAGVPNPTGNVTFNLYVGLNCSGNATSQTVAIAADGTAESSTTTATADLSYQAVYAGDANYPGHTGACEPLHVIVQQGQITPTQVDCTQFASGTAPTQTDIFYKVSGGLIAQSINPGVFFYWTHITTTVPNQVVTVTQSNTSTNNSALFKVAQGWARLYQGDCSSYKTGTLINGDTGASFTVAVPGDYIIGIKYDSKSLAGTIAPVPANIVFNFITSLGGSTAASVKLTKQ